MGLGLQQLHPLQLLNFGLLGYIDQPLEATATQSTRWSVDQDYQCGLRKLKVEHVLFLGVHQYCP